MMRLATSSPAVALILATLVEVANAQTAPTREISLGGDEYAIQVTEVSGQFYLVPAHYERMENLPKRNGLFGIREHYSVVEELPSGAIVEAKKRGSALDLLVGPTHDARPIYQAEGQRIIPGDTLTVGFSNPPSPLLLAEYRRRLGLVPRAIRRGTDVTFQGHNRKIDPLWLAEQLKDREEIEWIEPGVLVELFSAGVQPNDPLFENQWYLKVIGIPEVWDLVESLDLQPAPVTVGILDDGLDFNHRDLSSKVDRALDYSVYPYARVPIIDPAEPLASGYRLGWHGTAVAGIIAAVSGNDYGVAGMVPAARILPIRVKNSNPHGEFTSFENIEAAFYAAFDEGVRLFNLSWGGPFPSRKLITAIADLTSQGALFVCAAGNRQSHVDYPARSDGCLAVGALRPQDDDFIKWNYSNSGPGLVVDLAAPSGDIGLKGDIWTTDVEGVQGMSSGKSSVLASSGDFLGVFGGTSAAAPMVTGAAALMKSLAPELSMGDIRRVLQETATRVGGGFFVYENNQNEGVGFGLLNVAAAVRRVLPEQAATQGLGNYPPKARLDDVDLCSEPTLVGLIVREQGSATPKTIAQLFDDLVPAQIQTISEGRHEAVYLVERSALGQAPTPADLRSRGIWITPVYSDTDGSLVVTKTTVSVSLRFGESPESDVIDGILSSGFELLGRSQGGQLTFAMPATFRSAFEASDYLSTIPGVRWAEPNVVVQVPSSFQERKSQ